MTTTGAHSDEEHELIPTGSKTVDHCFTEMCTTEPSCYFTFMQLRVTVSNNMTLKTKPLTQWRLKSTYLVVVTVTKKVDAQSVAQRLHFPGWIVEQMRNYSNQIYE